MLLTTAREVRLESRALVLTNTALPLLLTLIPSHQEHKALPVLPDTEGPHNTVTSDGQKNSHC